MTRISPLCVGSVRDSPLFSLAPALPSKTSSGRPGLPPFGSFIGTIFGVWGGFRLLRPVHIRLRRNAFLDRTAQGSQNGGLPVLVHMVSRRAGLFDYVEFRAASRSRPLGFCLPFHATRSAFQIGFSELNPPAHRSLCLRFARYLTITNAKLKARMVRYSFAVGLFHMPVYPGALTDTSDLHQRLLVTRLGILSKAAGAHGNRREATAVRWWWWACFASGLQGERVVKHEEPLRGEALRSV